MALLKQQGIEVVLVSSGSVAEGMARFLPLQLINDGLTTNFLLSTIQFIDFI
jgi:glutamate 5-kinase